jgi:ABC-type transporter Mla MlaB component
MHPDQDPQATSAAQQQPAQQPLALAPVETTRRVAELHQQLLAMIQGDEPLRIDGAAVERIDGAALQLLLAARLTSMESAVESPIENTNESDRAGPDATASAGAAGSLRIVDPSDALLDAIRVLGLTALTPSAAAADLP